MKQSNTALVSIIYGAKIKSTGSATERNSTLLNPII